MTPASSIPDNATGEQLVDAIRAEARRRGISPILFAGELSPSPGQWLGQVEKAAKPKPATIARVRALLAGEPIPSPPPNNFQRSPRTAPRADRTGADRLVVPAFTPVDREPCFHCGVRGDIGCEHRR